MARQRCKEDEEDPKVSAELARFWEKVDKSAGPAGCWIWLGSYKGSGPKFHQYGAFSIKRRGIRNSVYAHRYVYELAYGRIPKGLVVMHECDRSKCCNPLHLKAGTVGENNLDCNAKGRRRRGGSMTSAIASRMRHDHIAGMTYEELNARYGFGHDTIARVVKGRWFPKTSRLVTKKK